MIKNKKYSIWDSEINYEDWRADMDAEYPELPEEEKYNIAAETNQDYLGDEHINLKGIFDGKDVILAGNLRLWDGGRNAFKIIKNANAEKVLSYHNFESAEFYVKNNELYARFAGHDDPMGNTLMRIRIKKDGLTQKQENNLEELLENFSMGRVKLADMPKRLSRYTYSPAREIAAVYGW